METACDLKYTLISDKKSDLSCSADRISEVWEENVRAANVDKYTPADEKLFGCLNQGCCSKLQLFLNNRLNMISATCFVLAIFMYVHILSLHYMTKIRQRFNYQVKIFQHGGDYLNLVTILLFGVGYIVVWRI